MSDPAFLTTPQGRRIAYRRTQGAGPGIVFLSGFKSDMMGTKAVALEEWAKREGRAYLRFDYSGHGESDGEFTAGCIGDWAEDARAAWHRHAPDDLIQEVTVASNGHAALVTTQQGMGLVWAFGADSVARPLHDFDLLDTKDGLRIA